MKNEKNISYSYDPERFERGQRSLRHLTTEQCLALLYDDEIAYRGPENYQWNTEGVPSQFPLDLVRDTAHFTKEMHKRLPRHLKGAYLASLGCAGSLEIERRGDDGYRPHSPGGRFITRRDVEIGANLALQSGMRGDQCANSADYIWLILTDVMCAENMQACLGQSQ